MNKTPVADSWAQLRFAIVGPLLACPPGNGELKSALHKLAACTWTHPLNGTGLHYSASTIERWFSAESIVLRSG